MHREKLPRKGEEIELEITTSAFGGKAVGRNEGLVYFVKDAVPGDRIKALVLRRKKNFVEARMSQLIEASKDRVEPRCQHFGVCGGCHWQNLSYPRQLEEKQLHVQDLFKKIAGINMKIPSTIPSKSKYCYRNKMEFSFGVNRWLSHEEIDSGLPLSKGFALGLHKPGRYDKLVDIKECFLPDQNTIKILNRVREISLNQGWNPYNSRTHKGFLRNLVFRSSESSGHVLLGLITTRSDKERMKLLGSRLQTEFKQITSLVNAVNQTRSPVAAGEETIIFGSGEITEMIGNLSFQIPLTGFFQPNSIQAKKLYQLVLELCEPEGEEFLFDIYCGMGCIGLYMASNVGRVFGLENDARSVVNARSNALKNRIKNVQFKACDALEAFSQEVLHEIGNPDIVVLDPPRAGLHKNVLKKLLQVLPSRIVYVSCNPATQSRDVASLLSSYNVHTVQPVDMFPQTPHIECVVRLDKK